MLASMIAAMIALMVLAVPVAVAIGLAGMLGATVFGNLPLIIIPQQAYVALDKFPLAAVPFFILAGNIMATGGISHRLIDMVGSAIGRRAAGLPASCVLVCMVFAAVSGSSVATTFAIGDILIPAMARQNYPLGFAASLQATSAELGVIIPPSIPMILYGVAAGTNVGDLFIAGLGPGLLVAVALIVYVILWTRFSGHAVTEDATYKPFWPSLWRAALAMLMPVIILGGIYGGVFTPTGASIVAVAYALLVSTVVYRDLSLRNLVAVIRNSAISAAIIMFIISMAGLFFMLTRAGVPAAIGDWLNTTFDSRVSFLLAVNRFLFIIGMFVEMSASIVVLAPILAPVAASFGIHPTHFGMIVIMNLAMGMITPSFGVNLFAVSAVGKVSLDWMIPPWCR